MNNNLEVLKIKGNNFKECQQDGKDYKQITIAYLMKLKYLDYELIDEKEKETAFDNHKDEINTYAAADGNEEKVEAEGGAINQELIDAKIETTANIFNNVLKQCEQYNQVKHFLRFPDVQQTTDGQIEEHILKF